MWLTWPLGLVKTWIQMSLLFTNYHDSLFNNINWERGLTRHLASAILCHCFFQVFLVTGQRVEGPGNERFWIPSLIEWLNLLHESELYCKFWRCLEKEAAKSFWKLSFVQVVNYFPSKGTNENRDVFPRDLNSCGLWFGDRQALGTRAIHDCQINIRYHFGADKRDVYHLPQNFWNFPSFAANLWTSLTSLIPSVGCVNFFAANFAVNSFQNGFIGRSPLETWGEVTQAILKTCPSSLDASQTHALPLTIERSPIEVQEIVYGK